MRKVITILVSVLVLGVNAMAQHGLDRGYDLTKLPVAAAKGTWVIGGTGGYSMHANNDFSIAVVNGVNSAGYSISASPEICYFVKDNTAWGARLSYRRSLLDLDSAGMEFGDVSLSINDYHLLSQKYTATFFLRNLIPIVGSGRLSMYVDLGFQAYAGREKNIDGHSGHDVGTWQQKYGAAFVVDPGFTAMITKNLAIYAGVAMAGLEYGATEQVDNQVGKGKMSHWSGHYLVDLTDIRIGLQLYL